MPRKERVAGFPVDPKPSGDQVKHTINMTSADSCDVHAAPEVLAGNQVHGSPVDYWSLGCILYAMVWGCYPFLDKTDMSNPSTQFNKTIQKYVSTPSPQPV